MLGVALRVGARVRRASGWGGRIPGRVIGVRAYCSTSSAIRGASGNCSSSDWR